MPADLSFAAVNNYVHGIDVQFEDLQGLCLGLADEIERLRKRIESAPVAIMDTRDVLGICAPAEKDFPALYAIQGRRVRLVVDDTQWQCTVCGRIGTVGRCCGLDTRLPINELARQEEQRTKAANAETCSDKTHNATAPTAESTLRDALARLLKYHQEGDDGAELPREYWSPGYREAVEIAEALVGSNAEVTGAARTYRAASVLTAGLCGNGTEVGAGDTAKGRQ